MSQTPLQSGTSRTRSRLIVGDDLSINDRFPRGVANTVKTAGEAELAAALAVPGKEQVPNIPLDHLENKRLVGESLRAISL